MVMETSSTKRRRLLSRDTPGVVHVDAQYTSGIVDKSYDESSSDSSNDSEYIPSEQESSSESNFSDEDSVSELEEGEIKE